MTSPMRRAQGQPSLNEQIQLSYFETLEAPLNGCCRFKFVICVTNSSKFKEIWFEQILCSFLYTISYRLGTPGMGFATSLGDRGYLPCKQRKEINSKAF